MILYKYIYIYIYLFIYIYTYTKYLGVSSKQAAAKGGKAAAKPKARQPRVKAGLAVLGSAFPRILFIYIYKCV